MENLAAVATMCGKLRTMTQDEREAMQDVSPTTAVSKTAKWTGWILSTLPVLLLLMSAWMKLSRADVAVKGFAEFGFPDHAIIPIGVVELLCTILYILPWTAVLGAILLTGYMGGAVNTHVRAGEPWLVAAVVGVLVWLALYLRDPRVRALAPLRSVG